MTRIYKILRINQFNRMNLSTHQNCLNTCPFLLMTQKNIKKETNCISLRLTIKRNKKNLVLENDSLKGNGYVTLMIFTSKT